MKLTALFLLIFMDTGVFAQGGLLGRNQWLDLTAGANVPLLSGSFGSTQYRSRNNEMRAVRDWVDFNAGINYQRGFTRRRSMGFQAGIKWYEVAMPEELITSFIHANGDKFSESTGLRFEALRCRNIYFAPRIEWATNQGTSGIGLCFDFSAGISFSKGHQGTYAYSVNQSGASGDGVWTKTDYVPISFKWKAAYGVFVQTGIKLRVPFRENLSWQTGFHYTVIYNIPPKNFTSDHLHSDIFSNRDSFYKLQRENLLNCNFDTGICWYFGQK